MKRRSTNRELFASSFFFFLWTTFHFILLFAHNIDGSAAVVLNGTATYYSWPSGGNSCNANSGMCVAPSDGWTELWFVVMRLSLCVFFVNAHMWRHSSDIEWCSCRSQALGISSKCDYVPPCDYSCDVCCQKAGPGCPYDQLCSANGGSFCVRCIDSSDVCKSYDFVRVQIADACPSGCPSSAFSLWV